MNGESALKASALQPPPSICFNRNYTRVVDTIETSGADITVQSTRGKTRADKDREVAEFLQRHGVNRNAKTAGTKWDNMLGEFIKVYEWERGGERGQARTSYFKLKPHEKKDLQLPASFDEEVFDELSQFMGSRMRTSQSRGPPIISSGDDGRTHLAPTRALPPPPPFKEDDFSHPGKESSVLFLHFLL